MLAILKVLFVLLPSIWQYIRDTDTRNKGANEMVGELLLLHSDRIAAAREAREHGQTPENDPMDRSRQ